MPGHMERSDFLSQAWPAYPVAPRGEGWVFGRYERQNNQFILHIRRGHRSEPLLFSISEDLCLAAHPEPLRGPSALSVLRTGDWVALRPPDMQLLAPNLLAEVAPALRRPLPAAVQEFARFRGELRSFMEQLGFEDFVTPSLVVCPGTEPFLDVFSTELRQGSKQAGKLQRLYLPTSPELHLKKALAFGVEKIYELRPCFRNNEVSERHSPEFWMLEWYRAFADLEDLKEDCRQMIRKFWNGRPEDLVFSEISVAELFSQLGFELTPQTSLQELKSWCQRLGISAEHYELWDDVFYLLFVERIEPFLPSNHPLFVVDYPPSQAALARVNQKGWAERFELYWRGLEIANAYHELNDPDEQLRRTQKDLHLRQELGREDLPLDEDFFQALRSGLPPSAGIALGVERLFMAARGVRRIQDLQAFPYF